MVGFQRKHSQGILKKRSEMEEGDDGGGRCRRGDVMGAMEAEVFRKQGSSSRTQGPQKVKDLELLCPGSS